MRTFDPNANIFFLNGIRMREAVDNMFEGLRSDFIADDFLKNTLPSVVVGSMERGKPVKGAAVVPALITDRPLFNKASKVIRGSVIDQDVADGAKRKVIVSHKEGNDWYVMARTGLRVGAQGMMGDYLDLSAKGELKSHGSFNFDKNSGAVKLAESREEKAAFGSKEAESIWRAKGKKIPGLPFGNTDYAFWRVPVGAVVIVRDINGRMTRLIGGKTQLLIEDATGYGKFFDNLLGESKEKPKAPVAAS